MNAGTQKCGSFCSHALRMTPGKFARRARSAYDLSCNPVTLASSRQKGRYMAASPPFLAAGKRELHTFETRSAGLPGDGAVAAKKNEAVLFPFQVPSTGRAHHWKKRELIFSIAAFGRQFHMAPACMADRTLQDRVNEHITVDRKRGVDQALRFANEEGFDSLAKHV